MRCVCAGDGGFREGEPRVVEADWYEPLTKAPHQEALLRSREPRGSEPQGGGMLRISTNPLKF